MVDDIACPDCAETIKAEAKVCRFCGLRLQSQDTPVGGSPVQVDVTRTASPFWLSIAIFVGLGVMFFALMFVIVNDGNTAKPSSDIALLEKAKIAVNGELSDPGSAQYQNLSMAGICVSGEVNAKNKMGGYVGFKPFLFDPQTKAVYLDVGLPEKGLPFDLWMAQMNEHSEFSKKNAACLDAKGTGASK